MKPHNNFNNIIVQKNKFQCNEHHHISNLVAISIYNVLKPNLSYIKCYFIYKRERESNLNAVLFSLFSFFPSNFWLWFICVILFDHLLYTFQTYFKLIWSTWLLKLVTDIHVHSIIVATQCELFENEKWNDIHGKMAKLSRTNFSS